MMNFAPHPFGLSLLKARRNVSMKAALRQAQRERMLDGETAHV